VKRDEDEAPIDVLAAHLHKLADREAGEIDLRGDGAAHGFRMPGELDNRPLTFEEFEKTVGQVVYMSATPGPYELEKAQRVAEQLVRPTGIVDPPISVRPTEGPIVAVTDYMKAVPDQIARFEKDLEMYTNNPGVPDAEAYFDGWTTAQIAQKANGWKLNNVQRYSDPKYDAIVEQLKKELNPEKRAQLQIQANDFLVNNFVIVPIIDRNSVNGRRADLINTARTPWDWNVWNIAHWQIKK